jgi:2-iminobutanoate/2-iminopropanoate deaminase
MEKINVTGAPDAIGPYCHAVRTGNLVFCSGQGPLDPKTKKISGKDISEQTMQVLNNVETILKGMGLSLQNVIKSTVFLKEMEDFQGMNSVYAKKFSPNTPARSTVAVKKIPLDALVEIECIAEIPG